MQTFNMPFHTTVDVYPVNSSKLKLGMGYEFASRPKGPPQITFQLTFKMMFWWITKVGNIDRAYDPDSYTGSNIAALIDFYELHQLYDPFIYPHPSRGELICRFDKPLSVPKNIEGLITYDGSYSGHQVESFTLDFLMQP